ncbi:DUF4390 domain-containing protein [Candidatus Dependentiae bacterium]|nr:DUF4390 domain-containing protein [Candidatus Dependentiae bacterium]
MKMKSIITFILVLVITFPALALDFSYISFSSNDDRLTVEVGIKNVFTKDAFDSLLNGQEIKIYLDVTIFEKRPIIVNKKVQSSKEKNIIQYNVIIQKYHIVVGKKPSNRDESFESDQKKSIESISNFKKLVILSKDVINPKKDYIIHVNVKVVSLKMSPPLSFIFDLFFDLNYSISKSFNYTGSELLKKYFN